MDEKYEEVVCADGKTLYTRKGTLEELQERERREDDQLLSAMHPLPPLLGNKAGVKEVIEVSKFVWTIIQDTQAQAATEATTSRVLSKEDTNWQHYELARDFASKVYTYRLNNLVGTNCFTVSFKVAGTHRATNPDFGGQWIPNVHITFTECKAKWPWKLNGSAVIDSQFVSNMGTREEPVPQLVLNVKLSANAKVESREKTFEFTLNAQSGVKLIN